MGNKTRKHHNIGEVPTKRPLAPLAKANAVAGLEFPFIALADLEAALGDIPNFDKVVQACPAEYKSHYNQWNQAASHIFFNGVHLSELRFKASDKPVMGAQMQYLRAWLGSFEPSHEVKTAVCGWLLSLMLAECPQWK